MQNTSSLSCTRVVDENREGQRPWKKILANILDSDIIQNFLRFGWTLVPCARPTAASIFWCRPACPATPRLSFLPQCLTPEKETHTMYAWIYIVCVFCIIPINLDLNIFPQSVSGIWLTRDDIYTYMSGIIYQHKTCIYIYIYTYITQYNII